MTFKRTLLVDGDLVLHKVASAVETSTDWGDGVWTTHADEKTGKAGIDLTHGRYKKTLEADRVIYCLSSAPYFRNDFFPAYKENRTNRRRPLLFKVLSKYLVDHYNTFVMPDLEADDVAGILATKPGASDIRIIVANDKDMLTIPGFHANPDKGLEVRKVEEDEADYWHLRQTLIGDTIDNYKGCPGVGPVRAKEAIFGLHQKKRWPKVLALFEKAGLTEEDALVQARLARILRWSDYDHQNKTPKLWTPTASI